MVCSNCKNATSVEERMICIERSFKDIKQHFQDIGVLLCSKDADLKQLQDENAALNRQITLLNVKLHANTEKESSKPPSPMPMGSFIETCPTPEENNEEGSNLNNALNSEQIFELSELCSRNDVESQDDDEAAVDDGVDHDDNDGDNEHSAGDTTPGKDSYNLTDKKEKTIETTESLKKCNTTNKRSSSVSNSRKFYYSADQDDAGSLGTDSWLPTIIRARKRQQHVQHHPFTKIADNSAKRACSNENNRHISNSMDKNMSFTGEMILESPVLSDRLKLKQSSIETRLASRKKRMRKANECKWSDCPIEDITFDFSVNGDNNSFGVEKEQEKRFKHSPLERNLSSKCNEIKKEANINSTSSSISVTNNCPEISDSVMILASQPKEVVFVDDASSISSSHGTDHNNSLHLDTMDLLNAIRNDSEPKLRKYEQYCLRKSPTQSGEDRTVRVKSERNTTPHSTNDVKEYFRKVNAAQPSFVNPLFVFDGITDNTSDYKSDIGVEEGRAASHETTDEDEDDDGMPRPIVIKQEPGEKQRRPRIDSNCRAADLIERPNTPDGFWNPHILSFATDDIRNNIVIDNRFKNL